MSLLHVRQIDTFLKDAYADEYWDSTLADHTNLSRMLARYALDLGISAPAVDPSCLMEMTDGTGDRGIDGVAVDPGARLVVVVQSKWRSDGSGSVDLGSVLKFLDGVRSLLDIQSAGPSGCSDETRAAVRRTMDTPGARLRMVVATTAAHDLSEEVRQPIEELLEILNDVAEDNPIAEFVCLTQTALYDSMSRVPRPAIDLDVHLLDWGRATEPIPAFYGRMSALAVAEWYLEYGDALFAENIRVVLPKSEINEGIVRTIKDEPERLWYYNNGITILASSIARSLSGAASREAGFFKAVDASVINGAQTVSSLGRALRDGQQEALSNAYLAVRCIEVADDAPEVARRITRYTNTQNVVSSQDFVFLDEEQHRLVREMRLAGFEYILRSGEVPSSSDPERVIDVRQAAVAMACASSDLANAVLAKREVSRLFDRETGPYRALFNPEVNGLFVQRSVDIVRRVDRHLAQVPWADGGRSGVAVHGNRVIAHVVLNELSRSRLLDPSFPFAEATEDLPSKVEGLLDRLSDAFPSNAYPGNVFKNLNRCRTLLAVPPTPLMQGKLDL